MKDVMIALFGLVGVFTFLPAVFLLDGAVLRLLWRWFVSPVFGWRAISLAQAVGISLVVGFLTHQHIPRSEQEGYKALAMQFSAPLFALAVGWIVAWFL